MAPKWSPKRQSGLPKGGPNKLLFWFFRVLGPQVPQEGPKDPQVPSKGKFWSDFRQIWESSRILGRQNDAQSGAEWALKEVTFGIVWVKFWYENNARNFDTNTFVNSSSREGFTKISWQTVSKSWANLLPRCSPNWGPNNYLCLRVWGSGTTGAPG